MLLISVLLLVYPVFVADEDEFVRMAQVRELLRVQEAMLETLFESVVQSLSIRLDEVVKSVKSIRTSLEFTQKNTEELKPVQAELIKTNKEIERLNSDLSSQSLSLEYICLLYTSDAADE